MNSTHVYDLIGVGVGVFNLSLAAFLAENNQQNVLFFDKQEKVTWHAGLLLESSELQVNFLKDLATPVDPQSRFTFLNYLKNRKILYQFMNRKTSSISRNQFQSYFRWVSDQLASLRFNSEVNDIAYNGEHFIVTVNEQKYYAKDIAVSTGILPVIPQCARTELGEDIFHVKHYTQNKPLLNGQRIAVVGGGQSSAEVFKDIMETCEHSTINWFGRRLSFSQLEDNCFINEFYVPSFLKVFRDMKEDKRADFINKFAMSSDGINQDLLDSIYRLIFERLYFSEKEYTYNIQTGQELVAIERTEQGLTLEFKSWYKDKIVSITVDKVVLATGFKPSVAHTLKNVLDIENPDIEPLNVDSNFQLQWRHQDKNKIFVQNGSRQSIGLVDPNLSVAAWRAAMIANEVLGFERYSPEPDMPIVKLA